MYIAKPKRPLALPLVALAIFLPVLAACGGSDDSSGGSGAASGSGSGVAAGSGATGKGNDQYLKFAQCMRQNGVPEWPDPIDGTKFRLPRGSDGRPVINPKSPQFKAAAQKCESLRPPGWTSQKNPAAQAQALKYAQCMRKNGVPQFPDPQGGAQDIGDANPHSPQFKAAAQKCQSLRPAGGGG
ncbi:hypothetical protein [Actinomadura sp. 6N118]|uniref:hypothetical protein n=1 Tax=Actinomadura sp. 6N118 TaxID=3375151 RepID=UPI0037929EB3